MKAAIDSIRRSYRGRHVIVEVTERDEVLPQLTGVAPSDPRDRPIDPRQNFAMDLLERISPTRYDADAIAEAASKYS